MIVRNEEKYLRECLESVSSVADEIVIIDTGSTDGTIGIALEFGAKIYDFDWIDDFSAARNYALNNSSGDWILYLDADERLDKNSIDEIIRRTENLRKVGFYCTVKSFDSEGGREHSIRYPRLFANNPNLSFTGKVHEQIEESLTSHDYLLANSKILINHIGYNVSKSEKKNKAGRNLALLLAEYNTSKSPYYAFQIAQTYNVLDESENARKYFQIAIDSPKLDRLYKSLCYTSLSLIAHSNHKTTDAEKLVLQSLKMNDKQPFAHLLASKIYLRMGDMGKAEEKCRSAFEINKELNNGSPQSGLEILVDPEEIIFFGLVLAIQNRSAPAINYYQADLESIYRVKYPAESEQIFAATKKLVQNVPLNDSDINLFGKIIKNSNLNFFLFLLGRYSNVGIKTALLEKILPRFEKNEEVIKSLSKVYEESGRIEEAIAVLESDENIRNSDPVILFYLLSHYLKKGIIEKVFDIINSLEINFSNIPEVASRVKMLKEKISHLKIHA
jgi:glycosyltransferase involved in cell wall biosynthesis